MDGLHHLLGELWTERRRVGLVALGVAWGTLGLTVLLAFGGEMVTATKRTVASFGGDLVRLGSGATTMPFEGLPAGRQISLRPGDAEAVRDAVPEVLGAAEEYSSGYGNLLEYGGRGLNVSLTGVEPGFGEIRNQVAQPGGRFLNRRDEAERRRVAFLGDRVKDTLFGDEDAVGRSVELRGVPFTVVGVLVKKITHTNYNGEERDKVVIPASTFRDLRGWRNPTFVMIELREGIDHDRTLDSIYRVLARRHRFDPSDRDALELQDYVEIENWIDQILDGNRIFTAVVGILGLLVSVVGLANVLYVMVEERKQEIGVQLALGARPRSLALAKLGEGLIVTLAGGVAGALAAGALLWGLAQVPAPDEARAYMGSPSLSWSVAATVVVLLATAGALAGWIPARRAAGLDPVEALRAE